LFLPHHSAFLLRMPSGMGILPKEEGGTVLLTVMKEKQIV
jgi:hypothetical protein